MPSPVRVLVSKAGLDGHDRGAKVVAQALVQAGMEVLYLGLHTTPEQIIATALDEDVDVVGLSILSGAHITLATQVVRGLAARTGDPPPVAVGGVLPLRDREALREAGVSALLPGGTPLSEVVATVARLAAGAPVSTAGSGSAPASGSARSAGRPVGHGGGPATTERRVILESGFEVKPLYGPEDLLGQDIAATVGVPGHFPFTRGIHPLMYRAQPFTMRQYAGFGSPAQTNERFRFLLANGQNALNVAFDLPTQLGLDSDDPRAQGEVGRVGMAVDSLADLEVAFEGIPLQQVSTSMTINSVAPVLMAMYFVMARRQGVPLSRLSGTAQNDILKEFIARGTWIFPVEASVRLVADTIEFCAKEVPRYYPVSVCGYHIREAGANPVQEVAYAYAIAQTYIDTVLARGLSVDDFAGRISFNFDIHGNFFEQIAKFRAARRLWANLMRDRYGAEDVRTMQMKMIAGGGGGGLTVEEPLNNIVRGAYYALISALSGTQTMALCCYDEAYTIPSEQASLVALRTMQILIEEMGLGDTVDPLGGSYYVESLTNEMERRIRGEMEKVGTHGGIATAITRGLVQREVAAQALATERALEDGTHVKVGVNRYRQEGTAIDHEVELYSVEPSALAAKMEGLQRLRRDRDGSKVAAALERVGAAAASPKVNIMPALMEAVEAYATVGEITTVLRHHLGSFKEPPLF